MTITITLFDALLLIGGILLIVFIIYCIIFVKNLLPLLKTSKSILEDVNTITTMTTEQYEDLNEILNNVKGSAATISKALKGNESIVAAVTSIINSFAHLKGMTKNKENKEKEKK
ncbi:MAG: hypothetical protein RR131_03535 [Anaerovorax sp.]